MKPGAYASLAAFLAHWRALKHASAGALKLDELARRTEMDEIIAAALRPEERAALDAAHTDDGSASAGTARRHRERAEVSLARELRARGLLAE
jgi:hypothetical protein